MRGPLAMLAAAGALAGGLGGLATVPGAQGAAPAPGQILEAGLGPSDQISLFGLADGPDGSLWFTDLGCIGLGRCAVGRIDTTGALTLYRRGLAATSVPFAITASAGDLWFTDEGAHPAIGRITPAGRIREFRRGLPRGSEPFEIAAGRNGAVWFTDQGRRPGIGEITPRGRITEFHAGLGRGSIPFGITTGADGREWFTDRGCSGSGRCGIGTITAAGRIRELRRGLRAGARPLGIAAGLDGDVWFADASGAIGRVTPAGRIAELTRGLSPGSSPTGIALGADGNMWFSDQGSRPAVGRATRGGRVTEYRRGLNPGSQPAILAAGADGRVYFSDEGSTTAFGTVATGTPAALRSAPVISGDPASGGTLTCAPARWSAWAGRLPSADAAAGDGFRWRSDGRTIPGAAGPRLLVPAGPAGRRISCTETVTYPPPLWVTAVATSAAVTVS